MNNKKYIKKDEFFFYFPLIDWCLMPSLAVFQLYLGILYIYINFVKR